MLGVIAGFFKLSFLLIIFLIFIFSLSKAITGWMIDLKKWIWNKRRARMIAKCKLKLAVNPKDEETKDKLKRLECNYLIVAMYDYIFYLQEKYGGWQVCPNCKFPGAKDMLICANCDFVTPQGHQEAERVRRWANSED